MVLDADGLPVKNANGEFVYKYVETGEVVEWDKLPKAKETKKFLWFFDYKTNKKRLALMPIWYTSIKNSMYDYIDYIEKKGIFTERGLKEFEKNMKDFF